MNYKDSLIKNIKWKQPKLKITDDGKCDLNIHVPLSDIIDTQAKLSFLFGVTQFILWERELPRDKPIDEDKLKEFFYSAGVGEYFDKVKRLSGGRQ